jgi:hypothetical protein
MCEELVRIWREEVVATFKFPFLGLLNDASFGALDVQRRMRTVLVNYEFRMWNESALAHFKVHSQYQS